MLFLLLYFVVQLEIKNGDTSYSSIAQDSFSYPVILCFHMKLSIACKISVKGCVGIVIDIALYS